MSAISRLDQYLQKHDAQQRRTLRAKKVATPLLPPPPPPHPPPPTVLDDEDEASDLSTGNSGKSRLTVRDLEDLELTLVKEHRYRMHRLKQVRSQLESTLTLLAEDDLANLSSADDDWDAQQQSQSFNDEEGEETSDRRAAVDLSLSRGEQRSALNNSLTASRSERRAKIAFLVNALDKTTAPSSSVGAGSRMDISSAYVNSLLGL